MKYIQLGLEFSDELQLKSISIQYNETELKSDAELIIKISKALLISFEKNKESIELQEILSDVGISKSE
jgi:hypothetical protein